MTTLLPLDQPGALTGNPYGDRFQAMQVKFHVGAYALGMTNSQFTGKEMLAKATAITGVAYKRGQYAKAKKDLETWLAANPT